MMYFHAIFLIILTAVLCFVSYRTYDLALWYGYFRHAFNHEPGPCRSVPNLDFGSEDIKVLPNGLAFISSGMTLYGHGKKGAVGRIYTFDFNRPNDSVVELGILADEQHTSLNPHGICLWTNPTTGNIYLYVINHHAEGEAVDKYQFDPAANTLTHLRRIDNDPTFHSLNSLVVVAEDQFYVTNYKYANDRREIKYNLRWGTVVFYDGIRGHVVDDGLLLPNGITIMDSFWSARSQSSWKLEPSPRHLLVAHLREEEIRVYVINEDSSITFVKSIKVWTVLDNLNIDPDTGEIWTGAHIMAYKVFEYVDDPNGTLSPSNVLKVKVSLDGDSKVTEVYSNDGSDISGCSVAARYKNGLLLGTVFTNALYCELRV